MQMFIAFNPEDGNKSKDVLIYFAHCLNADIREGTVGQHKGWMFIFKDEIHPFRFGGKRKYTAEDEDAVAEDIRNGKSLRKIAQERHMATTTVHTLHKRYLMRNPAAGQFPVRIELSGSESPAVSEPVPQEAFPTKTELPRSETEPNAFPPEAEDTLSETDINPSAAYKKMIQKIESE
ncbi:MAG: hypothetical protein K6G83_03995 [Lachnospiraceae bacterium]|nr:hypothetical protein [Lachnospiraceae bacterium]